MFIQTYRTGGTRPTFPAELRKTSPAGGSPPPLPRRLPVQQPALDPRESGAVRPGRPAGADRADRPGPETRRRRHVKVAEVWTFGFTGGEVGVERGNGSQAHFCL